MKEYLFVLSDGIFDQSQKREDGSAACIRLYGTDPRTKGTLATPKFFSFRRYADFTGLYMMEDSAAVLTQLASGTFSWPSDMHNDFQLPRFAGPFICDKPPGEAADTSMDALRNALLGMLNFPKRRDEQINEMHRISATSIQKIVTMQPVNLACSLQDCHTSCAFDHRNIKHASLVREIVAYLDGKVQARELMDIVFKPQPQRRRHRMEVCIYIHEIIHAMIWRGVSDQLEGRSDACAAQLRQMRDISDYGNNRLDTYCRMHILEEITRRIHEWSVTRDALQMRAPQTITAGSSVLIKELVAICRPTNVDILHVISNLELYCLAAYTRHSPGLEPDRVQFAYHLFQNAMLQLSTMCEQGRFYMKSAKDDVEDSLCVDFTTRVVAAVFLKHKPGFIDATMRLQILPLKQTILANLHTKTGTTQRVRTSADLRIVATYQKILANAEQIRLDRLSVPASRTGYVFPHGRPPILADLYEFLDMHHLRRPFEACIAVETYPKSAGRKHPVADTRLMTLYADLLMNIRQDYEPVMYLWNLDPDTYVMYGIANTFKMAREGVDRASAARAGDALDELVQLRKQLFADLVRVFKSMKESFFDSLGEDLLTHLPQDENAGLFFPNDLYAQLPVVYHTLCTRDKTRVDYSLGPLEALLLGGSLEFSGPSFARLPFAPALLQSNMNSHDVEKCMLYENELTINRLRQEICQGRITVEALKMCSEYFLRSPITEYEYRLPANPLPSRSIKLCYQLNHSFSAPTLEKLIVAGHLLCWIFIPACDPSKVIYLRVDAFPFGRDEQDAFDTQGLITCEIPLRPGAEGRYYLMLCDYSNNRILSAPFHLRLIQMCKRTESEYEETTNSAVAARWTRAHKTMHAYGVERDQGWARDASSCASQALLRRQGQIGPGPALEEPITAVGWHSAVTDDPEVDLSHGRLQDAIAKVYRDWFGPAYQVPPGDMQRLVYDYTVDIDVGIKFQRRMEREDRKQAFVRIQSALFGGNAESKAEFMEQLAGLARYLRSWVGRQTQMQSFLTDVCNVADFEACAAMLENSAKADELFEVRLERLRAEQEVEREERARRDELAARKKDAERGSLAKGVKQELPDFKNEQLLGELRMAFELQAAQLDEPGENAPFVKLEPQEEEEEEGIYTLAYPRQDENEGGVGSVKDEDEERDAMQRRIEEQNRQTDQLLEDERAQQMAQFDRKFIDSFEQLTIASKLEVDETGSLEQQAQNITLQKRAVQEQMGRLRDLRAEIADAHDEKKDIHANPFVLKLLARERELDAVLIRLQAKQKALHWMLNNQT